jgi:hypothetical protein
VTRRCDDHAAARQRLSQGKARELPAQAQASREPGNLGMAGMNAQDTRNGLIALPREQWQP